MSNTQPLSETKASDEAIDAADSSGSKRGRETRKLKVEVAQVPGPREGSKLHYVTDLPNIGAFLNIRRSRDFPRYYALFAETSLLNMQ